MIAPGAITSFWIGSGQLYSTAVQQALDNYTGLDAKDLALINSVITNLGSNYDLIDELFLFVLGSNVEANGLIGLRGTIATNNGATFDVNGATFSNAEHIDLNWNPNDDGVNYTLNDSLAGAFVKTRNGSSADTIFGSFVAGGGDRVFLQYQDDTNYNFGVNIGANTVIGAVDISEVNTIITRTASDRSDILNNGVSIANSAGVSTALPPSDIFVGARNNDPAAASNFFDGIISTTILGGAIGFDQALFNTVIRNSLTAYGTI